MFTSQMREEVLRPEQDHPDVVPPFSAYSPTGNPMVGAHIKKMLSETA